MEFLVSEILMNEVKGMNDLEVGCLECRVSLCFLLKR